MFIIKIIFKLLVIHYCLLFMYKLFINYLLQVVRDKVKKFAQLAASGVRPE